MKDYLLQGPPVQTSCIILHYSYVCCSEMTLLLVGYLQYVQYVEWNAFTPTLLQGVTLGYTHSPTQTATMSCLSSCYSHWHIIIDSRERIYMIHYNVIRMYCIWLHVRYMKFYVSEIQYTTAICEVHT